MRGKAFLLIGVVFIITIVLGFNSTGIDQLVKTNPFLAQFLFYQYGDNTDKNLDYEYIYKPIEYMYVTILENDPVYDYTFQEMNQLEVQESLKKDPRLSISLQIGTKQGPAEDGLDNGLIFPGATIEVRGNSARYSKLKSYKISLDKSNKAWNHQYTINLNKHSSDYTHIRNKLSFDYFHLIPELSSLETQFVNLYIKDLTDNSLHQDFVDYGIFTHVEQLNQDYFMRKALDPNGYLYKAINFEFYRYPDQLRNRHDMLYDKDTFDSILSIRGREYHDRLLDMLDDLNNEALDINKVVEKHFDIDNVLTWFAVNIIMANLDSSSNNFYLYSPLVSDTWYFIPWDYDGAWNYHYMNNREVHPFREGLTLYSGWPWVKRYFQAPGNLQALNDKIDFLSQIITEEQTREFLEQYDPIVRPFMLQEPDIQTLPEPDRFDEYYYSLVTVPKEKVESYYRNIEIPFPIFIGGPWIENEEMTFTWSESVDLQGDDIFYDLKISETPDFTTTYYEQRGLQETSWKMDMLPQGVYYWQVIIRDSKGNEQIPYETLIEQDRMTHGVKKFNIE